MYNQFTDRYRFVEVEVIKSAPFWGRKISARENRSQQLFRSKEYVCTLLPNDTRSGSKPLSMRVYKGDAIYKIDMRPHAVPFVGSFRTKDNFVLTYNFTLILIVSNAVMFAKGYSVGQDPVLLAIEAIHEALKKYSGEHEHDKLCKLGQPASDWNIGLAEETGVKIQDITKWILHEDVKRLETAEIEQDTVNTILLIKREAETKILKERGEMERAALQHMYQLHNQLSNTAANELKAILQERIRDSFESNQPIDRVAEETLNLLNTLYKGIENFSYLYGIKNAKHGASTSANGNSPGMQNGTPPGGNGTNPGMGSTPSGGNGNVPGTSSASDEEETTILVGTMLGYDDDMPPMTNLRK